MKNFMGKGVIIIDLIEALKRQMQLCRTQKRYKCGVYVASETKREIVMDVVSNIVPIYNRSIQIRKSQTCSEAIFSNGNMIKIVSVNNGARENRFNGIIIDNMIDSKVVDTIILPYLMPLYSEEGFYEKNDNPLDRMYVTDISGDDIVKSKNHRQLIYESSAWRGHRATMSVIDDFYFKKEYMCMFNDYDRPVVTKELNNDKVMLYEAWGIPKGNITYKTEFINKTKQTYLNVVGKNEMPELGFENDINIHLLIDTDVYDRYEVNINDGMVMIVLHEIKNEAPKFEECIPGLMED